MSQTTQPTNTQTGHVSFVGAGPGAIDLLTLRGQQRLQTADIVLHDALVEPEILAIATQAIKLPVGKRNGQASMPQAVICELLVSAAKKHQHVVRLKGGDVSIFARLDEEISMLKKHNIAYDIVPGITTASAAAASLAKPLTQRNISRSVAFLTGDTLTREMPDLPTADSLIIYMGRRQAKQIAASLINQGRSPYTPVILIANVSRNNEQHIDADLADIAFNPQSKISQLEADAPLLWMIGEAFQQNIDATAEPQAQSLLAQYAE